MVHYNDNAGKGSNIDLSVKNACSHNDVMVGIITALRHANMNPDQRTDDKNKMNVLYDLLEAIIPDEIQLTSGIKPDKKK